MKQDQMLELYKKVMPIGTHYLISHVNDLGFFDAPASIGHHGAYTGGLFEHSLQVCETLVDMTERLGLNWKRKESPYIIGMFHDLCKVDNYKRDSFGKWNYNKKSILDGHGEKSIIMLQPLIQLTGEEIACIRWHMGAFETDSKKWEYYGRAIEQYPNVLYTHTADMIVSRIKGV